MLTALQNLQKRGKLSTLVSGSMRWAVRRPQTGQTALFPSTRSLPQTATLGKHFSKFLNPFS